MVKKNIQDTFAEEIAERFIQAMKDGTSIFHKGWESRAPLSPMNPTSGNTYSGVNFLNLSMAQDRMGDPRWMTFKQAKELGAQVKKGEKGTRILYWKTHNLVDKKDSNGKPILDAEGKKVKVSIKLEYPRAFYSTVFNATQIDGLEPFEAPDFDPESINKRAEEMIKNTGADIRFGGNHAYYKPSTDHIQMPLPQQFEDYDTYISTLNHELGHWTGHHTRLDRDFTGSKGDESYAREELRAELCSYMMNLKLGIKYENERHEGYINSWVKILEDDPNEIIRASAAAEKMSEYLLSFDRGVSILKDNKLIEARNNQAKENSHNSNLKFFELDRSHFDNDHEWDNFNYSKELYQIINKTASDKTILVVDDLTYQIYGYKNINSFEKGIDSVDFIARSLEEKITLTYRENGDLSGLETFPLKRDKLNDPATILPASLSFIEQTIKESLTEKNMGATQQEISSAHFDKDINQKIEPLNSVVLDKSNKVNNQAVSFNKDIVNNIERLVENQFNYSAELISESNSLITLKGSHGQLVDIDISFDEKEKLFKVESGKNVGNHIENFIPESNQYELEQSIIKHIEQTQKHSKDQIKEIFSTSSMFTGDKEYLKELAINKITSNAGSSVIDTILDIRNETENRGVEAYFVQQKSRDVTTKLEFKIDGKLLPINSSIKSDGSMTMDIEDLKKELDLSESEINSFKKGDEVINEQVNKENENTKVAQHRIYLNVAFDEKERAKSMGARWSPKLSLWYVPVGAEYEPLVNNFGLAKEKEPPKPVLDQFREAMESAGLDSSEIIGDGKIHRVSLLDDPANKKNGAYALHLNQQVAGGYIQNMKTGEKINWRADVVVNNLTDAEKKELRDQAEMLKAQREAESKLSAEKASKVARAFWEEAVPVIDNDYCNRKQVSNIAALKVVPETISNELYEMGVRIAQSPLDVKNIREDISNKDKDLYVFIKGSLLIPAVDQNHSIQTIQQVNNIKAFMKNGVKSNSFYTTDGKPVSGKQIILTEGYATADAVSQITGKQVVSTFDVGNLEAVAKDMRKNHPQAEIIIAADNDHLVKEVNGKVLPNIGVLKANEIAKEIKATVLVPPFDAGDTGTDWNDLLVDKGIDHAKDCYKKELDRSNDFGMDR